MAPFRVYRLALYEEKSFKKAAILRGGCKTELFQCNNSVLNIIICHVRGGSLCLLCELLTGPAGLSYWSLGPFHCVSRMLAIVA
jgi:hypothetical protein